jgi:hypothetical protein
MLKASPGLTISPPTRKTQKYRICWILNPTMAVPGWPTDATLEAEPKASGEMKAMPEGGGATERGK